MCYAPPRPGCIFPILFNVSRYLIWSRKTAEKVRFQRAESLTEVRADAPASPQFHPGPPTAHWRALPAARPATLARARDKLLTKSPRAPRRAHSPHRDMLKTSAHRLARSRSERRNERPETRDRRGNERSRRKQHSSPRGPRKTAKSAPRPAVVCGAAALGSGALQICSRKRLSPPRNGCCELPLPSHASCTCTSTHRPS